MGQLAEKKKAPIGTQSGLGADRVHAPSHRVCA